MDMFLISGWNKVVPATGLVYHLGDFCFGDGADAVTLINQLNGSCIRFLYGNHDRALHNLVSNPSLQAKLNKQVIFDGHYREIKIDHQKIVLCHYAFKVWNCSHRGSWNLFGHSHYTLPDDPNSFQMDVGVDNPEAGFAPFSFERVRTIMSKKVFKPIDHHGTEKTEAERTEEKDFSTEANYGKT